MANDNQLKEYFPFFRSFYDSAMKMSAKDRGQFLEAVCEFALNGTEKKLTGIADVVFCAIRPVLIAHDTNFRNGKKGGRPRKESTLTENQKGGFLENEKGGFEKIKTNKDKDKDKDNKQEKERIKEKVAATAAVTPRFIKPTLIEVMTYVQERGKDMDAEAFYDFYESKGWKVGSQPMKDWKAAVRNWERKDRERAMPKHKPTYDELHPIGDFSNEHDTI